MITNNIIPTASSSHKIEDIAKLTAHLSTDEALAVVIKNRQYFAAVQPFGPAFGIGFSEEAAMLSAIEYLKYEGELLLVLRHRQRRYPDGLEVVEITQESYDDIATGNPDGVILIGEEVE